MTRFVPEILAPAGGLEKLKVAVDYGANAVYLAGLQFGLRSAAENFTRQELQEGVEYAHTRKAKVYVVLNGFLHDSDLESLPDFVTYLAELSVDAVIVSDLGAIRTVQKYSKIPVHLSTQASCLNSYNAKFWKNIGVERVVLGREVSIEEASQIKKETGLEIEMFIHGSMCMAYSGNCVISNFTQGRDSNRGGCAHSCRFEYGLVTTGEKKKNYFMSSKDLNGMELIPKFIEHEIDSLKIEGRMKSHLYAATMSLAYSKILEDYKKNGVLNYELMGDMQTQLDKVPHRAYTTASLDKKADGESVFDEREISTENEYELLGQILEIADSYALIHVRNAFCPGDSVEILDYNGQEISFKLNSVKDLVDNEILKTKPSTVVKIALSDGMLRGQVIRRGALCS